MRANRLWAALAAAAALAGVPVIAAAQEVHPGEQGWLGLTGAKIPPLLKAVAADPYKAPAEPACETIPAEILALDRILGTDADQDKAKTSYVASYAGREARGAVRGLIPYRGVVRFLTGADKKDRELVAAAQAGFARRGFLRGLEANLHCAPQTQVASADAPALVTLDPPRRLDTDYQPPRPEARESPPGPGTEPATEAADDPDEAGAAQADDVHGGGPDLGAVMLIEPRGSGFDPPGR